MQSRVTLYLSTATIKKPAWLCTCGLLLLLFALLTGCENDIARVKELGLSENTQMETGSDVEILYSEMGNVTTKITAPTVKTYNDDEGRTEFPDGLKMYFYNTRGEITSELEAGYGMANDKKEEMLVRGDAVITNNQGKQLNSEELIWKRKEKKIYSDKFVKITTPTEIVMGEGLRANEDFSDYEILDIHDSRIIVNNDAADTKEND